MLWVGGQQGIKTLARFLRLFVSEIKCGKTGRRWVKTRADGECLFKALPGTSDIFFAE